MKNHRTSTGSVTPQLLSNLTKAGLYLLIHVKMRLLVIAIIKVNKREPVCSGALYTIWIKYNWDSIY